MGALLNNTTLVIAILAGMVVVNAGMWLLYLWDQRKHRAHTKEIIATKTPPQRVLPPAAIKELESAAKLKVEKQIDDSAQKLAGDLRKATDQLDQKITDSISGMSGSVDKLSGDLTKRVSTLSEELIKSEMEAYRQVLIKAREEAATTVKQINTELEKERGTAMESLHKEVAAQKEYLMKKFDTKLADTFAAYLLESLGQDIDLGAQNKYILTQLNEHKKQLKDDILNEF